MLKMSRYAGVMIVAGATLFAGSAFAFEGGQTGFSGRQGGANSCLACHGSGNFDGATIAIAGETTNCSPNDGSADFEIPLINVGATVPVSVTLPAPATAPACPADDCCGETQPGDPNEACLNRPGANRTCAPADFAACCQPGLNDCTAGAVAGFNIEVTGSGILGIPGSQQACEELADCPDGELCRNDVCVASDVRFEGEDLQQLTHSFSKPAGAGTDWTVNYVAPPSLDAAAEGPAFFLGANIANGNGFDDNQDLNGNFQLSAGLTDGEGNFVMPGGCLVCGDNGRPAVNGSCCACVSASPGSSVAFTGGIAALLGFFLVGGKRRRRR